MGNASKPSTCFPMMIPRILLSSACGLAIVVMPLSVNAGTISDNFSTSRNYLTNGVAGTIWDGVYFGANEFTNVGIAGVPGRTLKCDANLTSPGQLTVQTVETAWEFTDDDGFFLYKVVSGDFQAVVRIVTPYDNVNYNTAGLMARAFNPGGEAFNGSENFVSWTRFDEFGFANYGRTTLNNETGQINPGDAQGADLYWLMLERVGDTFNCYQKAAEADPWIAVPTCVFDRSDLNGQPMQVGIIQATFSPNTPVVQFEKFSLTGTNIGGASPAGPTGLTIADAGSGSFNLSWTPGTGSDGSVVVMRPTAPVTRQPSAGATYSGNPAFGSGDALGATNFVVYSGTGNSVKVTGLTASVVYNVAVYSYAGSGATTRYTSTPALGSKSASGALLSITLNFYTNSVAVDDTLPAVVMAEFEGGGSLDVTASSAFLSSAPNNAAVDSAGVVSGNSSGSAVITASYQGFSSAQTVSVVKLPVTDDFSVARDYLVAGLVGTPWQGLLLGVADMPADGFVAGGPGKTLVMDAGITTPGRLTIQTTATDWEDANDDGLLLYQMIPGDFKIQVQVTSFDPANYNFAGLMARAPFSFAGAENYVNLATFNQFGIGNYVRSVASGTTANGPFTAVPAKAFIMLERKGTSFNFYEKPHALDPWTLITTVDRPELSGVALQVGIGQACFSDNAPVTQFANLVLETGTPTPPGKPDPATNLVLSRGGVGAINAQWTPGPGSAGSLVIARALGGITRQPLDGVSYTANEDLGGSNIVIYAGSGNSVSIQNLSPVLYSFAVYAYVRVGGTNVYSFAAAAGSLEALGMPSIVSNPTPKVLYAGRTATFTATAAGTSPLHYLWRKGSSDLANGGNISGASSPTLTIANLAAADAGNYSLVVSNDAGAVTSSSASLTVLIPGGSTYESAVMSYGPAAYWRFGEAGGAPITYEYWNGFDGVCQPTATLGAPGPRPADGALVFGSDNTGVYFDGTATAAPITTPALNLNTDRVTMMCWINPATTPNSDRAGFFTCTGPNTSGAGFRYASGGENLGLLWNNSAINSAMKIPAGQWSFVAISVSPTEAVLYMGDPKTGLQKEVKAGTYASQGFDGTGLIGSDRNVAGRYYNGSLDEMVFFAATLSEADIQNIFSGVVKPQQVTLGAQAQNGQMLIYWPEAATGYALQTSLAIGPGASWVPMSVTPVVTNGMNQVTVPTTGNAAFYRLIK
jgi:hypothetical protein